MADTKQLEPLPPQTQTAGQPLRWWRRMRGNVLVVSVLIHVLFALIAGYFVVQHFQKPWKQQPVQLPLAPPLPKPKPISLSPPAQVKRITSTSLSTVVLPEMEIPPAKKPHDLDATIGLDAIGAPGSIRLPKGIGSLKAPPFGDASIQDGLTGKFYDLKQDPSRKPTGLDMNGYADAIRKFVEGGWKDADLARFYTGPSALGTYQFFIPNIDADQGPAAFRMEKRVSPTLWLAHYKATVIAPETGRFHFVGAGDDVMLVGFEGRLVLDRCWNFKIKDATANYNYGYTGIPGGFARGDSIDVVKGRAYSIDVLIGEEPGGKMFAFLFIEKEGETYKQDARGNPIFPVFRVRKTPLPAVDPAAELPPYDPSIPRWSVWQTVR